MKRAAKVLSWLALFSAAGFVLLSLGGSLHAELLSFPLIALAVAQLLILHRKN